MSIRFNPDQYEVKELCIGENTIVYRAFEELEYMEHPVHEIQKLSVYVPELYYQGSSLNGYTLHTAPIFMPNSVGGYMPGPADQPGYSRFFEGEANSIFHALAHGYVVVSAGVRGRGLTDAEGNNVGIAPADICDLKAAVRWIRYNREIMPGNVEKIVSNGTSAGGAMSSLMGATGDHPDYEPYLQEMGAALEKDHVFASSCYCPITNLDHADMAYEWEFNGINAYAGRIGEGVLDENQQKMSGLLKAAFPAYFNSLALRDTDGSTLTMEADGSGRFRELILEHVMASAEKALSENRDAVLGDERAKSWLKIEDGRAVSADWDRYVEYRTRMKPTPAFDNIGMDTPENELFGSATEQFRHFTAFSKEQDPDGGLAEPNQVKLMNPMYYIEDDRAVKAKHFRIRHGAVDCDTSLAISEMFWLKLVNAGIDAEIAHPWGIPHSGDYDLPELFAWIDRICR